MVIIKMLEELKKQVVNANKDLEKYNLVIFTWGNVSAINREKGIIAIKPSGVSYKKLNSHDIVLVDLEGKTVEGKLNPSSDTPTHIELYKNFKDVKSVVHTHSTYATSFAQAKKNIDCFGTTHADHFYGSIPVTRDLTKDEMNNYEKNTGKVIVETFEKKNLDPNQIQGCLVASHGPFVWGRTIDSALYNTVVLEQIAKMNVLTLNLDNKCKEINQFILDKHYLRKHGKDRYYGQKK